MSNLKRKLDSEEKLDLTIDRIGTPFRSLTIDINRPKDNFGPNKKPKQVLSSIESQGRRRFHGAFTGGFSAGYFNTVGSEQGFTPSEYKSTRENKASNKKFRPQDFMDDEDINLLTQLGDIQNQKNQKANDPKNKFLDLLFESKNTSKGVELLTKMGWKEGSGIGPRRRRKNFDKYSSKFSLPASDIEVYKFESKVDDCGFGHKPNLTGNRNSAKFGANRSKIDLSSRNNLTSAYGISVLEENEAQDDIYGTEKLDDYNIEIQDKSSDENSDKIFLNKKDENSKNDFNYTKKNGDHFYGFVLEKKLFLKNRHIDRIQVPKWFKGIHKFDLPGMKLTKDLLKFSIKLPKRKNTAKNKNMNAKKRAKILGEVKIPVRKIPVSLQNAFTVGTVLKAEINGYSEGINHRKIKLEPFEKMKKKFSDDINKQKRFHYFINEILMFEAIKITRFGSNKNDDPKEGEKEEFLKIFEKFEEQNKNHQYFAKRRKIKNSRELATKKITRTSENWRPERLLCKRFDVPDPYKEFIKKMGIDDNIKIDLGDNNVKRNDKKITDSDSDSETSDQSENDGKPATEMLKAIFEASDSELIESEDSSEENESQNILKLNRINKTEVTKLIPIIKRKDEDLGKNKKIDQNENFGQNKKDKKFAQNKKFVQNEKDKKFVQNEKDKNFVQNKKFAQNEKDIKMKEEAIEFLDETFDEIEKKKSQNYCPEMPSKKDMKKIKKLRKKQKRKKKKLKKLMRKYII